MGKLSTAQFNQHAVFGCRLLLRCRLLGRGGEKIRFDFAQFGVICAARFSVVQYIADFAQRGHRQRALLCGVSQGLLDFGQRCIGRIQVQQAVEIFHCNAAP